jgi:hypothetical protein
MTTDDELWTSPAVSRPPLRAEQETAEALAVEPPERNGRKPEPAQEPAP